MLIKIIAICILSLCSPVKPSPKQQKNASSITREHSRSYKHTVTPLIIVRDKGKEAKRITKLPTGWIIIKKDKAGF
jgi:hypothetical protein